jgi:hypothetical protein
MASANPDQFVRLSTTLLEALLPCHLTGVELRIILWVLRNTDGWNRKRTPFRWYQIAKKLGGNRAVVWRAGQRLLQANDVPRVKAAIKRGVTEKGAVFRPAVNRNPFLCGCLDFTESLPEEHLIVGYGYRYGRTTEVERVQHVAREERRVSIPDYVRKEIRRHHFHRSDAEVIVFHNHPRTGHEPEWFYTLKSLLQDLPIASNDDRQQVQLHAVNPSSGQWRARSAKEPGRSANPRGIAGTP